MRRYRLWCDNLELENMPHLRSACYRFKGMIDFWKLKIWNAYSKNVFIDFQSDLIKNLVFGFVVELNRTGPQETKILG